MNSIVSSPSPARRAVTRSLVTALLAVCVAPVARADELLTTPSDFVTNVVEALETEHRVSGGPPTEGFLYTQIERHKGDLAIHHNDAMKVLAHFAEMQHPEIAKSELAQVLWNMLVKQRLSVISDEKVGWINP